MSISSGKIQTIKDVKKHLKDIVDDNYIFGITDQNEMYVQLPDTLSNMVMYYKNGKKLVNDGLYIDDNYTTLTSADIVHQTIADDQSIDTFKSSSVLSINDGMSGKYAFGSNLSNLKNIDLLCCEYIGEYAFHGLSVLSTVTAHNCKLVGKYAFHTAVKPAGVPGGEHNGWFAYDFPECLSVGEYAFYNNYDVSFNFPKLKSVGQFAFANCVFTYGMNAPELTSAGNYAFYYFGNNDNKDNPSCYMNANAVFPKLSRLGQRPFRNAYLSTLSLPALSNVGGGTFQDMPYLRYINIPMVSNFINGIFSNVPKLSVIDMHDKSDDRIPDLYAVSTITSLTSNPTIVVPDRLYDAWIAAPKWSECEAIRPGTIMSYTTYTTSN